MLLSAVSCNDTNPYPSFENSTFIPNYPAFFSSTIINEFYSTAGLSYSGQSAVKSVFRNTLLSQLPLLFRAVLRGAPLSTLHIINSFSVHSLKSSLLQSQYHRVQTNTPLPHTASFPILPLRCEALFKTCITNDFMLETEVTIY